MNTSLRDALAARIDQVGPAHPDLDALVGLGEQRLRRRRQAAIAGGGVAVVLAIGLALAGSALTGPGDQTPGPAKPTHHQTGNAEPTSRPLVYSDDVRDSFHVGDIHVGDHEVDIDQTGHRSWELDVTDAGVVYPKDHGLWFTDGGAPVRIAEACGSAASGSSGPLAIWFDCQRHLVVFDTASGEQVASKPLRSCLDKGWFCIAHGVVGEHAYFIRYFVRRSSPELLYRFDITTGRVVAATDQMYADDLRSHSRALVVGPSWRSGTVTDEADFAVAGSRLVPTHWISGPPDQPDPGDISAKAFDAASGNPVRLRLPSGYAPGPLTDFKGDEIAGSSTSFHLFEWLDDDTVALVQNHDSYVYGDILMCRLSDGRCRLAVPAGPTNQIRVVPGASFPG